MRDNRPFCLAIGTSDSPVPGPISTTDLAPPAAASRRSTDPAPGLTGVMPSSWARLRAVRTTMSSAAYASANASDCALGVPKGRAAVTMTTSV